jgi:hypothetical protein
MSHEPDWEALNQLNFLLAPRISGPLNEALNALTLAEMPESELDPQIWRDKAKIVVGNLLYLYQAWSTLIQFKNGIKMPPNAIRSFPVQSLLDWLTVQLGLIPPARAKRNFHLTGNQASIQEALLLLYTVSVTQGTEVHLVVDPTVGGSWFRIRFARNKPMPATVDEMVATFRDDWRSQDSAFELKLARDFVNLNDSEININWQETHGLGEFAFFIQKDRAHKSDSPGQVATPDVEHARIVSNITRSLLSSQPRTPSRGSSAVHTALALATLVPAEESPQTAEGDEALIIDPDATRQLVNSDDTPNIPIPIPAEGEDSAMRGEHVESQDSKPPKPEGIIDSDAASLSVPPSPLLADPQTIETESSDDSPEPGPRIISVEMPEPEKPSLLKPKKDNPADNEQEETPS